MYNKQNMMNVLRNSANVEPQATDSLAEDFNDLFLFEIIRLKTIPMTNAIMKDIM
jgi:3-deoxy-D-manno-octulosonate 8-phosphate phosphatase KdsC-like HAD superfamily phosphatase